MRYKEVPFIDPHLVYQLTIRQCGTVFLDSSMQHEHYGRYSYILINPLTQFIAKDNNFVIESAQLQAVLDTNLTPHNPNLPPFTGGLAGFFSYDLGRQFEVIPRVNHSIVPDFILGLYNQVFAFDHIQQKCWLIVQEVEGFSCDANLLLESLYMLYCQATQITMNQYVLPNLDLRSSHSKQSYMNMVDVAREYILNGDIFEVNCAQKYSAMLSDKYPLDALYTKLRQANPAPFSAYLNLGDIQILSLSPERFINIIDKQVEVRPIKGTIKRSVDSLEDTDLAQQLASSDKNKAENIMIVDLMRNDLAKVCIPKSIQVSQLCKVESYTNVHHLVSVVNGVLQDDISVYKLLKAIFPGGSITGAPKIRAMQIIEELESSSRGVYCGSIGYIGFNRCIDLSISIRTIVVQNGELSLSVGGAVTADSDSLDEYNESQVKGQRIMKIISGDDT